MPDDDAPSTRPGPPEPAAWRPWVPPGAEPPVARTADLPVEPPPRRSRWRVVVVGAGVLVLAGVVLAVWIGLVQPARDRRPARPDAAGTTATQATAGSGAGGLRPLRAPDTLGGMAQFAPQLADLPAEPAQGQVVTAAYQGLDGRTGVLLFAYRAALDIGRAEEVARFWGGGPGGESEVRFTPFDRGGLAIRCARSAAADSGTDAAVCYVEGPEVAVVLNGSFAESRMADLVAEAHRKLTG